MPSNFKKTLGSISAPENSAKGFVDKSSTLGTTLPVILGAVEQVTGMIATNRFKNDLQSTSDQADRDFKQEIADARAAMFSEAALQDTAVAQEYESKYSALVRAERQGNITGSNAGLRQEALLKQYINRFPHLEDRFRTMYSNTRALNEVSKLGEVVDPVNEGYAATQKEAASRGLSIAEVLAEKRAEYEKNMASIKAKNGDSIFTDLRGMVVQKAGTVADRVMANVIQELSLEKARGSKISAAEMEARFRLVANRMYFEDVEEPISSILKNARGDSPEARDAVLKVDEASHLRTIYWQAVEPALAYIKTQDSLEQLKENNELRKQLKEKMHLDIDESLDDAVAGYTYFQARNPQFADEAWARLYTTMASIDKGQINAVHAQMLLAERAGKTLEVYQHKLALAALKAMSPGFIHKVNRSILEVTNPVLPLFSPRGEDANIEAHGDAQALRAAQASMVPEDQAKIASAALKKNIQIEGRVGLHWAINSVFVNQLKNPHFQKEMNETIKSNMVASIGLIPQQDAGSIVFDPDSVGVPNEYKYGPFSSSRWDRQVAEEELKGQRLPATLRATDELNTLYWIKRVQSGQIEADIWAKEALSILKQIDKPPTPKKKETE